MLSLLMNELSFFIVSIVSSKNKYASKLSLTYRWCGLAVKTSGCQHTELLRCEFKTGEGLIVGQKSSPPDTKKFLYTKIEINIK